MELKGKTVGFAITGSFCTFQAIKKELQNIKQEGANVIPIFSFNAYNTDCRFGKAADFVKFVEDTTGNKSVITIAEAEKFGPNDILDILIIAPCTGNTLAKLNNGITDTPVLMAAKGHIRTGRPLVLSVSTNDALGMNFKNIFFVPFGQDNCHKKPNSMIAHTELIIPTLEAALEKKQIQPVIV